MNTKQTVRFPTALLTIPRHVTFVGHPVIWYCSSPWRAIQRQRLLQRNDFLSRVWTEEEEEEEECGGKEKKTGKSR